MAVIIHKVDVPWDLHGRCTTKYGYTPISLCIFQWTIPTLHHKFSFRLLTCCTEAKKHLLHGRIIGNHHCSIWSDYWLRCRLSICTLIMKEPWPTGVYALTLPKPYIRCMVTWWSRAHNTNGVRLFSTMPGHLFKRLFKWSRLCCQLCKDNSE